jgi:tol-pal system protein YbgF
MLNKIALLTLIVFSSIADAQVRVVESSPRTFGSGGGATVASAAVENDVYSQIRGLQEEISVLRGLIEEQDYQIKQLKQLQLDNYMDLDRRLGGGATAPLPSLQEEPAGSSTSLGSASAVALADYSTLSEAELYKSAFDLLNQKQFDSSVSAFQSYLNLYPKGEFASNSHYWLGKVAMLKKDYTEAKDHFNKVIDIFPSSQKVADAQLDLGKIYFLTGDKQRAQVLLKELALGNSEAARLAQRFLSDNF